LSDIIAVFENQQKRDTVVFIDTNPSFSNYTQAGIIAANRLIIPCTADYASIRGVYNVFYRVFGIADANGRTKETELVSFSSKAGDAGLVLPKIHSFVLNKSRSHERKASMAYTEHMREIRKVVLSLSKRHRSCFDARKGTYIFNVKDGNTLSAVLNYNGQALSGLQDKFYQIYDGTVRVNTSQSEPLLKDLAALMRLF